MNPLLDFSALPRFADIRPEHVAPAIEQLLAEGRAAVRQAEDAPATWEAFVTPLEDANERLSRAWGQVAHLHAVMDTPPLREAYNASLPLVTQYWSEIGQNLKLFEQYRALGRAPGFARSSAPRRRLVENALRDFRLAGAELAPRDKPRFTEIQEELARLAAKFSENLLDSTNAWTILVGDAARVSGIPADALEAAREAAAREAGWKFTLHAPSYLPVMQYADDRGLRETLYRQSATRASEFGRLEWDNAPLIARILVLRRESAQLLGYENYAEVSLVPKMARNPAEVTGFLGDLARRARPYAEGEVRELREFARAELGLAELQAWDLAYASEKLLAQRYAFSQQEVKQYFPVTQVVPGLFRIAEALYGVRIAERAGVPAWHPDVRFFEVRDSSGALIGEFYADLYARETKRGGAWMDDAIARRRKGAAIQTPVAHLACNFPPPVGGKPPLLTHDEVITLFHEFGHGLHHLLTRAEDLAVSGINGVEWDAVELPSQFMENFCWEWEVLAGMSGRLDSGEALPRALFERMLAAKNFQSGLAMLRQIEFALFDMRLHSDYDPARSAQELLEEVRAEVAVLTPPSWNRFPNSFSHVFAGGYAAGYYSYKWAEVLSADAYDLFEETRAVRGSVLDPVLGARFRDEVLAVGGGRPAAESFRAFRGREPNVEALLRRNGMIAA